MKINNKNKSLHFSKSDYRIRRIAGFTYIETMVALVLLSLLFIGFRYLLFSYWEVINRSWSQRYLEQYGNSVVEYIARNIINAKSITIAPNQGDLGTFYVTMNDPFTGDYLITYSATANGIRENGDKIFPEFPPKQSESHTSSILGPQEEIEIEQFSGQFVTRTEPPYSNPPNFLGRVFRVTLRMKYTRKGDSDTKDYVREMVFTSQVSLKMREQAPASQQPSQGT